MRNKHYKLCYDLSIIKDALLGEQSSLEAYLSFRMRDFSEISQPELPTNALHTRYVWLHSVYNQGHFTWRKCTFSAVSWLPFQGFS